jgi:hypothetical protein
MVIYSENSYSSNILSLTDGKTTVKFAGKDRVWSIDEMKLKE